MKKMSNTKLLIFNTFIIGIGNFATKFLSFLLLPLYTSYLTPTEFGIYDLFLTISLFLVPIITMLMEESMFRFLIDCKDEVEKKSVISQTIFIIFLSFLIFSIIYILISLFFRFSYQLLFYMFILSNIIIAIRNSFFRGVSKIKIYSILNFFTSLIIIVFNIIFIVYFDLGISSLFLSYIIVGMLSLIILIINLKNYFSTKLINFNKIKSMVKYSLPLIPNSLCWTVINLSDRLLISSFLGTNSNGIYSVAYKFPNIIDSFYGFFYTAWKESAAKSLNEDNSSEFYNYIYKNLKNILFAIVLLLLVIMPFVFCLLVDDNYMESYMYIPILVLSTYYSNLSGFYGGIFSAYKNSYLMGITTFLAAFINFFINIIFIKSIGLWAAAISTLIAMLFIYLYRKIKIKKYVILLYSKKDEFINYIILILVFINFYINNIILNLICLIFTLYYCFKINYNVFNNIYNNLKKKVKKYDKRIH